MTTEPESAALAVPATPQQAALGLTEARSQQWLLSLRQKLEEATTIPEIATLRDQAELVRLATRLARLGRESQNEWAVAVLDAERKAGLALRQMAEAGERAQRSTVRLTVDRPPTLVELGVAADSETAHNHAKRWQQAASIPEPVYAAYAAAVQASEDEVITRAGLLRYAKGQSPTKSHATGHAERLDAAARAAIGRQATQEAAAAAVARAAGVPALYDVIVKADADDYLDALRRSGFRASMAKTSFPYWKKRQYTTTDGAGTPDPREFGQEPTVGAYVARAVRTVGAILDGLTPEGVLFLNLGDTYASQPGRYRGDPERVRGVSAQAVRANGTAGERDLTGLSEKTLAAVPQRVMVALVDEGYRVLNAVCWDKVGHAPENVHDRLTGAWEPVLLVTRAAHCYLDRRALEASGLLDAFGRPVEAVDHVAFRVGRRGDAGGHLAPFPDELAAWAVHLGCPPGGVVLDPFAGSGTVRDVAVRLGRRFVGCDLLGEPDGSGAADDLDDSLGGAGSLTDSRAEPGG